MPFTLLPESQRFSVSSLLHSLWKVGFVDKWFTFYTVLLGRGLALLYIGLGGLIFFRGSIVFLIVGGLPAILGIVYIVASFCCPGDCKPEPLAGGGVPCCQAFWGGGGGGGSGGGGNTQRVQPK